MNTSKDPKTSVVALGIVALLAMTVTPTGQADVVKEGDADGLRSATGLNDAQTPGTPIIPAPALPSLLPSATATTVFFDDFDDGVPDGTKWSYAGATENNKCGGHSLPNALHFDGAATRKATTKPLDVSEGGSISFYLRLGSTNTSGCENADSGEDVVLEYSTNGGSSWTGIRTYDSESYSAFTSIAVTIPGGAERSNTRFQWRQLDHTGAGYDNWAIDDVVITAFGDRAPPTLPLQEPGPGEVVSDPRTTATIKYEDPSGIDLTSIRFFVDGNEKTVAEAPRTESELTYTPTVSWSAGEHSLEIWVSDKVGNQLRESWTFEFSPSSNGWLLCGHENEALGWDGECDDDGNYQNDDADEVAEAGTDADGGRVFN